MRDALRSHPHAAAVLGSALRDESVPSHAYLLAGPAGTGKREAAREFAAELLSRGAPDPESARTRVEAEYSRDAMRRRFEEFYRQLVRA